MIELGIDLERMRRRTPIGWVQSLAVGVAGAGFGAILQGGAGTRAWVALAVGVTAAVVIQFAIHDRSVNASNVCARFLRLLDQ